MSLIYLARMLDFDEHIDEIIAHSKQGLLSGLLSVFCFLLLTVMLNSTADPDIDLIRHANQISAAETVQMLDCD